MKRAIIILALLASGAANADPFFHHHGYYGRGPVIVQSNNDWVGPALVTGVIGYALGRNSVPQQPVIVQQVPQTYSGPVPYPSQYPVYVERQYCGPWTEIQNPDGTVTRSRACN
jgi:hypothetical protein